MPLLFDSVSKLISAAKAKFISISFDKISTIKIKREHIKQVYIEFQFDVNMAHTLSKTHLQHKETIWYIQECQRPCLFGINNKTAQQFTFECVQ